MRGSSRFAQNLAERGYPSVGSPCLDTSPVRQLSEKKTHITQLRGCWEAWSASGILFVVVKAVLLSGEVFREVRDAAASMEDIAMV